MLKLWCLSIIIYNVKIVVYVCYYMLTYLLHGAESFLRS